MRAKKELSHNDMVLFHADSHGLIGLELPSTVEEYVMQLMHLKAYHKVAKMAQGKTVLDLGCNTGYGTEIIHKYCNKIIGVDVSPRAIEEARKSYASEGIEFLLIDGKGLPFKSHIFDLVVCFQVIEHIVDYKSFLSEIGRILTPGGMAIFTTPNARLRLDPGMKPWNPFHVREFSVSELEQTLSEFFSHVRIQGLFADEFIYSIELNRVTRARKEAKSNQDHLLHFCYSFRTKLRNILPVAILEVIRNIRKKCFKMSPKADNKLVNNLFRKYSINDLIYKESDLEKALDLMAVCITNK